MADWLTHILVIWTICTILGFKFKVFNPSNTAICMVGALIPDIVKIAIPLNFFDIYIYYLIAALHTPAGSITLAAILSYLFKEKKLIFGLFIFGIITHYILDILLIDINSGIYLFYPLSWSYWQYGLYSNTDYLITLYAVIIALVVYLVSFKIKKEGNSAKNYD